MDVGKEDVGNTLPSYLWMCFTKEGGRSGVEFNLLYLS